MAPAVGSTEMRYCGISLFRTLDKMTIALWPEVPTGGVPQRMSLACDQADELATPRAEMTANAVSARLSMAFLPPNGSLVDGRSGHPSGPAVDTCRCGADRLDDEGDCLRESRGTIRQLHELGKDQNAARPRAQLGSGIWTAAASRICRASIP